MGKPNTTVPAVDLPQPCSARWSIIRHPFFWAGCAALFIAGFGGISGAWGFAAGMLLTIARGETRGQNKKLTDSPKETVD